MDPDHYRPPKRDPREGLPLFADPSPAPAIPPREATRPRLTDPETSRRAAQAIEPRVHRLHRVVLSLVRELQPITAVELEQHHEFERLAPSTVRKRVSELAQWQYLEAVGERQVQTAWGTTSRATLYALTARGTDRLERAA